MMPNNILILMVIGVISAIVISTKETSYTLHIKTEPAGAQISIVEPAMTYSAGMAVKPGRYLIRVQLEGYNTRDEWISVTSQDVEASIALEKSIITQNHPRYAKLGYGGVDLSDDATQEQGWLMTRDKETGLIWDVKPQVNKDERYNWSDAQSVFIRRLNEQRFGGFNDWRLPTKEELESLIKKGSNPAIDTDWFPYSLLPYYWSATSDDKSMHYAWRVDFSYGGVSYSHKVSSYYARAVRAKR